jgi:hypothetical protein
MACFIQPYLNRGGHLIKSVLKNLTLIREIRVSSLRDQLIGLGGIIGFAVILIVVGIAATIGIAAAYGVPVDELTRDPAAVMRIPYYIGLLSNWGIMLWSAAAAICPFFCLAAA